MILIGIFKFCVRIIRCAAGVTKIYLFFKKSTLLKKSSLFIFNRKFKPRESPKVDYQKLGNRYVMFM